MALRTELGLRLPPAPDGAPTASKPSVKGQTRRLGTMIIYYRRQVLADGTGLQYTSANTNPCESDIISNRHASWSHLSFAS